MLFVSTVSISSRYIPSTLKSQFSFSLLYHIYPLITSHDFFIPHNDIDLNEATKETIPGNVIAVACRHRMDKTYVNAYAYIRMTKCISKKEHNNS